MILVDGFSRQHLFILLQIEFHCVWELFDTVIVFELSSFDSMKCCFRSDLNGVCQAPMWKKSRAEMLSRIVHRQAQAHTGVWERP